MRHCWSFFSGTTKDTQQQTPVSSALFQHFTILTLVDVVDILNPIYTQLLEFQNDISRDQLVFDNPNTSTQGYIQTLARGLGLEIEYSTLTNLARITRRGIYLASEDGFLRFLDHLEESEAADCVPPLDLDAYDFPSSVLQNRYSPPLDGPENSAPTSLFGSAFPERDLPAQSVSEHFPSNNFGLDCTDVQDFFGSLSSLEALPLSQSRKEEIETQVPSTHALEESTFISPRNCSRAGSMNSRASENGRNRFTKSFSRRGSIQEGAYPGYQVYDSRSTHSAASSIASVASTGRRGPLSGAARALANAVKAVRACWRCKFLRKPVNIWHHT